MMQTAVANKSIEHAKRNGFSLVPHSKFDLPFPNFREPTIIGEFSHDAHRHFRHDRSQLKYLSKKIGIGQPLRLDLREGYSTFVTREEKNELLDSLLKWIDTNRQRLVTKHSAPKNGDTNTSNKMNDLSTDFICWRGLLTKLLCTPFQMREGWKIAVIPFCGTYYLCEFETEEKLLAKARETEREKEMCYWGHRFEKYMTADTPNGEPDTVNPVNNLEDFALAVRTRLNQHSLVYAGEVDCAEVIGDQPSYVELKTTREIMNQRQDMTFRKFKLLKWWAQSFLLGIPKVIGGFRNDDGIVTRLETFMTSDVPKMCKNVRNSWSPSVCFNFLDHFLQFIKDTVQIENDSRKIFMFTYQGNNETFIEMKFTDNSQYDFLPSWYCERVEDRSSTNFGNK